MISALTGELVATGDGAAQVRAGAMVLDVLVPAADVIELEALRGATVTFHTLVYLEGDPNRGNLEPRMIGFLRRPDREFFILFTTVKGIGPRTALRALTEPIGTIAGAIESRDTRSLKQLKGIGQRGAELIVAELSGKVGRFVAGPVAAGGSSVAVPARRGSAEEDAIAALMALGERRADADLLLDKARVSQPSGASTDALVREMLRLRLGR